MKNRRIFNAEAASVSNVILTQLIGEADDMGLSHDHLPSASEIKDSIVYEQIINPDLGAPALVELVKASYKAAYLKIAGPSCDGLK